MSVTPIRPNGDGDEHAPFMPPHGTPPTRYVPTGRVDAACAWCGTPTSPAVLAQLGTRCTPCYERWCREPQPVRQMADKRTGGLRAWARALKAREEAGEMLTQAAREMWRGALAAHKTLDAIKDGADVPPLQITAALQTTGDLPISIGGADFESQSEWELEPW